MIPDLTFTQGQKMQQVVLHSVQAINTLSFVNPRRLRLGKGGNDTLTGNETGMGEMGIQPGYLLSITARVSTLGPPPLTLSVHKLKNKAEQKQATKASSLPPSSHTLGIIQ